MWLFSPFRLHTVNKASAIPNPRTDWPLSRKLGSVLDLCVSADELPRPANGTASATASRRDARQCRVGSVAESGPERHSGGIDTFVGARDSDPG